MLPVNQTIKAREGSSNDRCEGPNLTRSGPNQTRPFRPQNRGLDHGGVAPVQHDTALVVSRVCGELSTVATTSAFNAGRESLPGALRKDALGRSIHLRWRFRRPRSQITSSLGGIASRA